MNHDEIREEVARRLARLGSDAERKCSYCVPGYRHRLDNCVLCGWGPAPGSIRDYGLEPMLCAELTAAFKDQVQ